MLVMRDEITRVFDKKFECEVYCDCYIISNAINDNFDAHPARLGWKFLYLLYGRGHIVHG